MKALLMVKRIPTVGDTITSLGVEYTVTNIVDKKQFIPHRVLVYLPWYERIYRYITNRLG